MCSFMRFSTDAKTNYLIIENEKIANKMYSSLQGIARIYQKVTQVNIPAIDNKRWIVKCQDYTDLATVKTQSIQESFPDLNEPPASVFVTVQDAKIVVGDFTKASPDFTTSGTVVSALLAVNDDQTKGLQLNISAGALQQWTAKVCYSLIGTAGNKPLVRALTAAKVSPAAKAKARRMRRRTMRRRRRLMTNEM